MKYLLIGGLSGILAGMCGNGIAGNALELTRDGKTDYAIIQGTNSTPAETFAAQELSAFLEKATGAKFAIRSETNQPLPGKGIYVGWTDVGGQSADLAKLGDEEWIIKTQDKNLILAGGRPRGTLYAVYEFLEQQVGFHWLDEFTEVTPSKSDLTLKELNVRAQPLFWSRTIYSAWSYLGTDRQKEILFEVRNKDTAAPGAQYGFGVSDGSPGGCHTFYAYSKDWQTNHPEYLAMNASGERVVAKDSGGPGQICLTNPEVRKLMLAKLRGYIAADRARAAKTGAPYPRIYCVEPNDNHWNCQCPECKAFAEREEAESGPLIDLVNSMADGIKDEYPDVLVDTFAYCNVLKPPKTIRPRDNVIIRIAQLNAEYAMDGSPDFFPDMFYPMTHAINRGACELLKSWSRIAKHLAYWDYWRFYTCAGNFATPYANLACIRSDLELFLDKNVEVIFVEMEEVFPTMFNHISFFSLKRWLGLKLLQNPRQDMEPLIQAFMAGYYGPATGKMREYLDYMERRVTEVTGPKKISAMKAHKRPYLDPDFFITSQRLLDEAEALCGTNKMARLHVRKERIPVDAALYCLWTPLQAKLPAGQTLPFDREAVLRRYESTCLEQMNTYYGTNRQEVIKKALDKQLGIFREIALNEKRIQEVKTGKIKLGPNLVTNPGFEEKTTLGKHPIGPEWVPAQPDGWSLWPERNKVKFDIVTDDPHSGKYAARISGVAGSPYITTIPNVKTGELYYVTAYAKRLPSKQGQREIAGQLGVSWFNDKNAWCNGSSVFAADLKGNQWVQLETIATVPDGATALVLLLSADQLDDGEAIFFDDVTVSVLLPEAQKENL